MWPLFEIGRKIKHVICPDECFSWFLISLKLNNFHNINLCKITSNALVALVQAACNKVFVPLALAMASVNRSAATEAGTRNLAYAIYTAYFQG